VTGSYSTAQMIEARLSAASRVRCASSSTLTWASAQVSESVSACVSDNGQWLDNAPVDVDSTGLCWQVRRTTEPHQFCDDTPDVELSVMKLSSQAGKQVSAEVFI